MNQEGAVNYIKGVTVIIFGLFMGITSLVVLYPIRHLLYGGFTLLILGVMGIILTIIGILYIIRGLQESRSHDRGE